MAFPLLARAPNSVTKTPTCPTPGGPWIPDDNGVYSYCRHTVWSGMEGKGVGCGILETGPTRSTSKQLLWYVQNLPLFYLVFHFSSPVVAAIKVNILLWFERLLHSLPPSLRFSLTIGVAAAISLVSSCIIRQHPEKQPQPSDFPIVRETAREMGTVGYLLFTARATSFISIVLLLLLFAVPYHSSATRFGSFWTHWPRTKPAQHNCSSSPFILLFIGWPASRTDGHYFWHMVGLGA